MGLLDGFIANIVGTELVKAGLSKPGTLTKMTPGALDPAHPNAPATPTTVDHRFDGFVASLTSYQIRHTLITNVTRIVKVYASTLSVVPVPGDLVTIENLTSTIANDEGGLRAVGRDPATAIWTLQCM